MDFKRYYGLVTMVALLWFVIAITFMGFNFNLEEVKNFLLSIGAFLVICGVIAAFIYGITDDDARSQIGDGSFFNEYVRCVLLDGAWGIGKTYYYEKLIKPNLEKKPIYITCFSATKNELITRLITSSAVFSILSLNGVLVNLMLNNWQSFMPKKQIIIFDDIERLHRESGTSYEDIMAVIDYLKKYNNILLIANISEISSIGTSNQSNIFNLYLERVVDEKILIPPHSYADLFNELIPEKEKNKIYNEIIVSALVSTQLLLTCTNIRLLKNCYYNINKACNELSLIIDIELSIIDHAIIKKSLEAHLIKLISMNYLYFKDHALYNKVIKLKSNSLSSNDNADDTSKKLEVYHLRMDYFSDYSLSQNSPIATALSCLSMKRQFVYYSLGNYVQNNYSEENLAIQELYKSKINKVDKINLSKLSEDKTAILKSNLLQFIDNKFLQMDSRGDYLESEIFIWGCIVYNEQPKLAKNIAKCLIKIDSYGSWTKLNYQQTQKYAFASIEHIIDQYLVWFYHENDTSDSLKRRYSDMFDGFLNIYLSVMYDLLAVEIDLSKLNNIPSEAYHSYLRNFFELLFDLPDIQSKEVVDFIKNKNLVQELERNIILHFDSNQFITIYAHLVIYYFKILLHNHPIDNNIRNRLIEEIEKESQLISFFDNKIKKQYPSDTALITGWKSLIK